jgi:hypothetical protein
MKNAYMVEILKLGRQNKKVGWYLQIMTNNNWFVRKMHIIFEISIEFRAC